jgi:hypothetical protein
MFIDDDGITFGFDQWRRLRMTMLPGYRPLAAWLYTDVQPNLFAFDSFLDLLVQAERNAGTVQGNGCWVEFRPADVVLVSLYDRWSPLAVPRELFWPVLAGLHDFLSRTAKAPDLARPPDYPVISRQANWRQPPDHGRPVLVDHTYFPREWSEQDVREAGEGAWRSAEALYDEHTGAWSGLWRGVELAGYYDPDTGRVQTYFPVLAP